MSFISDLAVSIHARLATGDAKYKRLQDAIKFQFTPVLRRATRPHIGAVSDTTFQFTPVLRRATFHAVAADEVVEVSIHARLATGDRMDG